MKLSIRDLLLVTVIVALAVGWWLDHRRASEQAKRHRADMDHLNGMVDLLINQNPTGRIDRIDLKYPLPNSQAPAPITPKK